MLDGSERYGATGNDVDTVLGTLREALRLGESEAMGVLRRAVMAGCLMRRVESPVTRCTVRRGQARESSSAGLKTRRGGVPLGVAGRGGVGGGLLEDMWCDQIGELPSMMQLADEMRREFRGARANLRAEGACEMGSRFVIRPKFAMGEALL